MRRVERVTRLVERVRQKRGITVEAPYFEPLDGGVKAQALFLLEAPGPKAVETGFVSRDNPDPSAKNMWNLQQEARLRRQDVLLWNIVPWYLGDGQNIRPPLPQELEEGQQWLTELLKLLSYLKVVVLVGRKAQRAAPLIQTCKNLSLYKTFHTSNQVFNRWPEKRDEVLRCFTMAQRSIKSSRG